MGDEGQSRRAFLSGAGGALSLTWLATHWPGIAAAQAHAATAATTPDSATLALLTPEEARDVEAIAAQIVPTDDTPGAREAGALYFIDRSLHTWNAAAADPFRAGLREFQARFAAEHSAGSFAAADAATQIAFLRQVETSPFFGKLRFLTLLGMFAAPAYGGNRGGIGWRLIGFDDAHAFTPPFGYYDRDYPGFVVPQDGV